MEDDKTTNVDQDQLSEDVYQKSGILVGNASDNLSKPVAAEPIDEPESTLTQEQTVPTSKMPAPAKRTWRRLLLLVVVVVATLVGVAIGLYLLANRRVAPIANIADQSLPEKRYGVAVGLIEGTAEYSLDERTWQVLTAETDLAEGNSIRTDEASRVVLLVDDGSAVRLGAKSQVELTDLNVENIIITNISGEVYNRVVASESRKYAVKVNEESYAAKGTAYRTFNNATKRGVEVYHSGVGVAEKNIDVPEGSGYFTLHDQKSKEGAVLALDLEALKQDAFIKWNSEQDKKIAGFSDKLGFLGELDKPAPPPPSPKPAIPATTTSGIVLKGLQSEYAASFSWTVKNVDVSKGYKLVRSKKTTTPTYPENSVAYIDKSKTSYSLYVGDGETYSYRLCAYRENGICDSYSNTVTVATTKKPTPEVVSGTVTLSMNASLASWTFTGTAPEGFKIVIGTSSGPTYTSNVKKYYAAGNSFNIPNSDLSIGTTYYVRVCKYTGSGCVDYSNELNYTP